MNSLYNTFCETHFSSIELAVAQIVWRLRIVKIERGRGNSRHMWRRNEKIEALCASETNIYIYAAISAHRQNTELNLTPMNSNADVCVFECVSERRVWVVLSSSMDVLSLVAPLRTHCSFSMFTQLFSTVSFSVKHSYSNNIIRTKLNS